ncbi:MAG: hypothetical protein E7665_01585 [Ruminococcaceae bacterium]|nr:hypothetical protein [Oscillospiraceae bacterium]
MSKGARKRESREEKILAEKLAAEKDLKNKKKKITITIITAVCLVIAVAVSAIAIISHNNYLDTGEGLRNTAALASDNFTVDNAMMSYYIYDTYYSIANYYSAQLSSWGLDVTKSIKKQFYSDTQSWFEFFTETAISTAKQTLTLAEAAHKNGISLSEDEISALKIRVSALNPLSYGRGITTDDILRAESLSYLAAKYDNKLLEGIDTSDKAIDAYYKEHKDEILKAEYRMYSFYFDDDESSSKAPSEKVAKSYAEDLAKCKTDEEYCEWLREYLTNDPNVDKNGIDAEIQYAHITNGKYTDEYESLKWVYDEKREIGDTYVEYDPNYKCYITYMITKPCRLDTASTINVRHVLFTADKYGTDAAAAEEAKKVYDEWKASEKTEESFALLAVAHSTDLGSANSGGLYENVREGEMMAEFNDWCFDKSRKAGDTGIVTTDYGIHLMYFCGEGLEVYKSQIKQSIEDAEYASVYADASSGITIKDNSKKAYGIPEKKL